MQSKYFLIILLASLLGKQAIAQNKPDQADGPSGNLAYPVSGQNAVTTQSVFNLPPEVVTGGDANSVTTYAPIIPIEDATVLVPGCSPNDVKQVVTYTDGNNVPFQTTSKYVAMINNQPKHLVQITDNRVQRSSFNFLPFSSGNSGLLTNAFQQQKDYYNNLYPGEGYTPFSQSLNSSNTTSRSSTSYAPGRSQVGQSHGTVSTVIVNASNEVRIWDIGTDGLPVSTGYYAAGELSGTQTIMPNGSTGINDYGSSQTKAFTDKDGRLILKMVADGNASGAPTFLYTYYVYDTKGNLIYTITPKAYEFFQANSATFAGNGNFVDNLCFKNVYDSKGRLIGVHKPNEQGMTYIVYDRKDRPVMRQTPKEATHEWEVTFYDPYGRVKATSVFESDQDQNTTQAQLDSWTGGGTADLMYYLATDDGEKLTPAENIISDNTIMSYTTYDNYNLSDPYSYAQNSYGYRGLQTGDLYNVNGAEAPNISMRVQGMVTGTKVRILPPAANIDESQIGQWRTAVNFYDDKGRVVYSVGQDLYTDANNLTNPIHEHYISYQYDFAGRVLIMKHLVVNVHSQDPSSVHAEFTKYQYENATGNLLKTWHKIDDGVWTVLNAFTYDDMGRVVRKSLGNGGEVQDYSYNIRGQLTDINGVYVETGNKQGTSKTFGESLKYDYGFDDKRYDGKLAGVIWRGSAVNEKYAYGYGYRQDGFLAKADFTHINMTMVDWANDDMDYSVSNLSYDKNGNIMSMNQKGMDPSNPGQPQDIDILSYNYDDWTNQLAFVEDQGIDNIDGGDFKTIPPSGSGGYGYEYDANGNLQKDLNKAMSISYTRFNKPTLIFFDLNNNSIEYAYDASGSKILERVDIPNTSTKTTEYIGNFIYVDNKLSYIMTSEGRTVFDDQSASPVREEFFVKDHLGNVRSTINVSTYDVRTYLATYELASANLESLMFENLDEVRDYKPGGDQGDYMAANLDGSLATRRIGSSLLVHVMAGDKVSMNVNNYYDGYNQYDDTPVSDSDVLSSIVGTLLGGAGGFTGSEAHDTKMVTDLFNSANYTAFSNIVNSSDTDPSKPKAYLNYILFDQSMRVVREMTGAFQANGDGSWAEIGTTAALEVPVNGYLAVYLSNASLRNSIQEGQHVFFDQLRFTVTSGNLLEESHYYPFGLPIKTLSSVTPEMKEQRRKYQGNEYITDAGLNWMDFDNRQYDPQIGRFLQIDPLAALGEQDMFSPYAAMGNMPEMLVDPNGLQPGLMPNDPVGGGPVQVGDMSRVYRPEFMGGSRGGGGSTDVWNVVSMFGHGGANLQVSTHMTAAAKTAFWNTVSSLAQGSYYVNNQGGIVDNATGNVVYGNGPGGAGKGTGFAYIGRGSNEYGTYGKMYISTDGLNQNDGSPIVAWRADKDIDLDEQNENKEGDSWWTHLVGPGLIAAGEPINYLKPIGMLGSKSGSSIASWGLSKIPLKVPFRLYTPIIERTGIRFVGTKVVGRFLGRLVPFVGWGLFAKDIWDNREFLKGSISQGARDFYDLQERALNGEVDQNGWPIPIVCFAKGTLIYGAQKMMPIENLSVGDSVFSYNLANNQLELSIISKVFKRESNNIYVIKVRDQVIYVTGEHPFYLVDRGWVKVKELKVGDILKVANNEKGIKIEDITLIKEPIIVYNIEVSKNHNYFVSTDKILVHNKNILIKAKHKNTIKWLWEFLKNL